jgi:hypothetical protein
MVGCVPANAGTCDNAVAEIAVVASRINLMFVMVSFGFETMTFGEVKRSLQSSFLIDDQRIVVGRQCGEVGHLFWNDQCNSRDVNGY